MHALRPYVLRNKTDGAGAKGLLEALRNRRVRPQPSGRHSLASHHLGERHADKKLALRGVAATVGIGVIVTDVSPGDTGGVRKQLARRRRLDLGCSFDQDEGEWKHLFVYGDCHQWIRLDVLALDRVRPGREEEVVSVEREPDGNHVGPAIGSNRG